MRHVEDYRTHELVLRHYLDVLKMRKAEGLQVLELGPGDYSTSLILEPSFDAHLVSFEDDEEWYDHLRETIKGDGRWLCHRTKDMLHEVSTLDLDDYDLILIDNGTEQPDREPMIRQVLLARPRGVVVIHDTEVKEYSEAILLNADDRRNINTFDDFEPWTTVID